MKLNQQIRALRAQARINLDKANEYYDEEIWPRLQFYRQTLDSAEQCARKAEALQRDYIYATDQVIRDNKVNRSLVDKIAQQLGHPPSIEELQGILKQLREGGQE